MKAAAESARPLFNDRNLCMRIRMKMNQRSATQNKPKVTHRRLLVDDDGVLTDEIYDLEDVKPGHVLVRTLYSGVSLGTELRKIRSQGVSYAWDDASRHYTDRIKETKRGPLGYESVGEVIDAGSPADSGLIGQFIWADAPHQEQFVLDAGVARLGLIDGSQSKTDLWKFAFTARVGIALNAVHDAQIQVGDNILVVGGGVLGCLAGVIAKIAGARNVFLADLSDNALRTAALLGLKPIQSGVLEELNRAKRSVSPDSIDRVIEASGTYEGLQFALKAVRMAGTVVTLSTYAGTADNLSLAAEWSRNRITLLSSMSVNGCPSRSYPAWNKDRLNRTAISFLEEKRVDPNLLGSRFIRFEEAKNELARVSQASSQSNPIIFSYL